MAKTKENKKPMRAEDLPSVSSLTPEERAHLIEELQKEIDSRTEEINKKLYLIEGGARTAHNFLHFLENDAQWKFTEAYGIIECTKEISNAMQNAEEHKGELFLRVLPIEAMWFFINKVEGVGLAKAQHYHDNLLQPVGGALHRIKMDRDAVNELMLKQGSLEAGADFEEDPKKEKEENAVA